MLRLQSQSSRILSNALSTVAKCQQKKNTMAILDMVLLSEKDGRLVFTAASTESQMTIDAPLSVTGGKLTAPIAFKADEIISFLGTLSDQVVNFTFNEDTHTLTMDYCISRGEQTKAGKGETTFQEGTEFPMATKMNAEQTTTICLSGAEFAEAIAQAGVFAAKDEVRLIMCSLCIDIDDDCSQCHFVATNGRTLFKRTHAMQDGEFFRSGEPRKYVIANTFFRPLSAFAASEQVTIQTDGQSIRFEADGLEFICKAVDGNYPNYNAIIPHSNPYFIVFDKKEMLESLKRVSIFGNTDSNLVALGKDGMFINLKAQNSEYSQSSNEQVFTFDASCDEGFSIGMSSVYLANAISAIDSDQIRMQMSDPSRPAILTSNDPNPRILTLCMPMRIE